MNGLSCVPSKTALIFSHGAWVHGGAFNENRDEPEIEDYEVNTPQRFIRFCYHPFPATACQRFMATFYKKKKCSPAS